MAEQDKPFVVDLAAMDYAAHARTIAQINALDFSGIEARTMKMARDLQHLYAVVSNFDPAELDKQIAIASKFRLAFINSGIISERANQIEIPKSAPAKKSKKQSLVVPVRKTEIITAHYSIYPPQPDNDGWDAVFDWLHKIPRYLCHTLKDLSEMIGRDEGTVRKKHAEYVAQHGKYPIGYWDDKK
jgi:hypothetical protein